MNITVNSQALAMELRLLSRVTPDKPTIPILGNVLMRVEEGSVSLHATDLQLALSTTCPATVEAPGTVTLPVKKLLEMVGQFPNADVRMTLDKGAVHIASGSFKSRLQVLPATDFPPIPTVEGTPVLLPAQGLSAIITRTRYAIAVKTQKFVLDGALLSLSGEAMAMVATDGKRLSLSTASRVAGVDLTILLPSHTLDALAGLAPGGDIAFSTGPRHMFFAAGKRLLISRMMDGKFPNYERIIPRANDKVATIERAGFAAALRRVGVVAEEDRAIYLSLSEGAVGLTSASAAVGQAEENLGAVYSGPPIRLCVNGHYILDFLEASRGDVVTLSVKDEKSAMLLADGVNFINVIMTMRTT